MAAPVSEFNLTQLRQHYDSAVQESDDQAQRAISLGTGAAVAVLLMTAPALGPVLYPIWLGLAAGVGVLALAARPTLYRNLREALLLQLLHQRAPLELELWERVAKLGHLPTPLDQYVEHCLGTYLEFKCMIREDDHVELGQVQLLQYREHILDFLDLAERTGRIRHILDTQGHRVTDEDKIKLRQRFAEMCSGLQEFAQSFDRSLGNLVVAQVLGDEVGDHTMETVQERMREIEAEFEEVKVSLGGLD